MLAKIKTGTPGGWLPATKHTQKMPDNMDAPFKPAASCAQSYRRLDAAENVRGHNNESLKGWIVKKAVDPFGLPV